MKRLGIFVFYDKEGIVDRYVTYLLNGIKEHLSELVIVCNGNLTSSGREKLEAFTDRIYVRENTGYDAMAYKLALTEYCGWNVILQYDEILLFNDTFFGPLYPFKEVFDKMDGLVCDFWGLTYHAEIVDYICGTDAILPSHIQTFFSVYRRSVLESDSFQSYWNEFDSTKWFFSDVVRHEQFFTKYLEDAGFTWCSYIEAKEYVSADFRKNVNPSADLACELIRDYRCPFVKRKNFITKSMSVHTGGSGENIANALKYIESDLSYDAGMIWENILRIYNVNEIKSALHLDYILPWETEDKADQREPDCSAAVIAILNNDEMLSFCMNYFGKIAKTIDLYIITSKESVRQRLEIFFKTTEREKLNIDLSLDCQYDMLKIFQKHKSIIKSHEYICLVNDKILGLSDGPGTIGKACLYNMWENMLKSACYINAVLDLFRKNCRLGFLAPPQPIHADYFGMIGSEWGTYYEATVALAKGLHIKANFSPDTQCFVMSDVFWCRSKAIMPLTGDDISYEKLLMGNTLEREKIPFALERIYPYIAQSQGFFSGIVMNTEYASLYSSNLFYYLSGVLGRLRKKYELTDYESVFNNDIFAYCKDKKIILVYGAGTRGIRVSNMLRSKDIMINGFIISDDQPKQLEKNGFPVYHLSEIPYEKSDAAIIVSVAYTRDRLEILANLQGFGYSDFFIL